jgi:hypothetical protein
MAYRPSRSEMEEDLGADLALLPDRTQPHGASDFFGMLANAGSWRSRDRVLFCGFQPEWPRAYASVNLGPTCAISP